MPNWACNHIVASGDEKDLRALAETLNTMPNLENGFGRYWMGNLVATLLKLSKDELMAVKGMHFRGTIDPDFYAQACLCGPYVDEKKEFTVDEDGMMRFSTTSAWGRSEDVEDLIMEHFPSVELAWSCTDEFGNFHITHNPDGLPELEIIAFNGQLYSRNEMGDLRTEMKDCCPGLEVPEAADADFFLSEDFAKKYCEWSQRYLEEHDDDDEPAPWFEVYEEV